MYNADMEQRNFTAEQLVNLAAEAGYEVTLRQVDRWREYDLLPRPRRIHLGKGKGTCSEYPREALGQLITLCRLHRTERRLHHLRFALWLEGYSVPPEKLKESIRHILLIPMEKLRGLAPGEDAPEKADNLAEEMAESSPRSKRVRRMKRNTPDPQDWLSLLTNAFQLFLAQNEDDAPIFENENYESPAGKDERTLTDILIDGWGLRRATTDRIGDAEPWLTNAEEFLCTLEKRNLPALRKFHEALAQATEADLIQARNDQAFFTDKIPKITKAIEAFYGQDAFGFSLLSGLSDKEERVDRSVFLLCVLLVVRREGLGQGIIPLSETIENSPIPPEKITLLIETLKTEVPSIRPVLKKMEGIPRGEISQEACLEQLYQFYKDHEPEMKAFWRRHADLWYPPILLEPDIVEQPLAYSVENSYCFSSFGGTILLADNTKSSPRDCD